MQCYSVAMAKRGSVDLSSPIVAIQLNTAMQSKYNMPIFSPTAAEWSHKKKSSTFFYNHFPSVKTTCWNLCSMISITWWTYWGWVGFSDNSGNFENTETPWKISPDIYHLERIQRAATRWVKGLRDLSYEERLRVLKLQSLEKRRIRNDLVLTHKFMFHQIDLEASKLFKFSRRPGLRRSSLRLLQQTGRTRRRRNSFVCRVVKYWNRLPPAVASVQDHLAFKRQLDNYIYT